MNFTSFFYFFTNRVFYFFTKRALRIRIKWNTLLFIMIYKKILGRVKGASGILVIQKTIIKGKGQVIIGHNVRLGVPQSPAYERNCITILLRHTDSTLSIGDNCVINNNNAFVIVRRISIGNRCMTGSNCQFYDSDIHSTDPDLRHSGPEMESRGKFIVIEDNVMVGANTICGPDVYICKNSVVGMGALLKRKKFPLDSIIIGNPARAIKKISSNNSV